MPARDKYHEAVMNALTADGWAITEDPLRIKYGSPALYIDLGAYRGAIGAEKDGRSIGVEVKSFLNPSWVDDFEKAVGQYVIYREVLSDTEPERVLYLAIPFRVYDRIFEERLGRLIFTRQRMNLLVFDHQQERIIQWITQT